MYMPVLLWQYRKNNFIQHVFCLLFFLFWITQSVSMATVNTKDDFDITDI